MVILLPVFMYVVATMTISEKEKNKTELVTAKEIATWS